MARGLSFLQREILRRAAAGAGIRPRDVARDETIYPTGPTMAARTAASRSLARLRRRGLLVKPPSPPAVLTDAGAQVAAILTGGTSGTEQPTA